MPWLLAVVLACGPAPPQPDVDLAVASGAEASPALSAEPATAARGVPEGASTGSGFVVFESDRSRAWRLWISDLEGGEPRRLTPNERRIHCCPHVSPDGEWIAYLSLEADQRGYPGGGGLGVLRRIRPDGSGQEDLAPEARTYYENRAAVWRSPSELIFIDGERRSMLLDLRSGEARELAPAANPRGYLISPDLRHAATGLAGFQVYDAAARRLVERSPFGGCQFYFSSDGRWGFWMAGAGGPLRKIDLASGEVSTWLRKSDPRLPEGIGYLYFPMLSPDRDLLVLAASGGEHDHFRADYDILAFEVDPETLEILGDHRRIAASPATDRFPDAWLEPLPLGRRSGESPFVATFEAPTRGDDWAWTFGDGTEAAGARVEHRWATAGLYEVTAASGKGEVLRGRVRVRPGRPPSVAAVEVVGGREVEVGFDEPVSIERARFVLESGKLVTSFALSADGRRVHLRLGSQLETADTLLISGVEDRASEPHRLAMASIAIPAPRWPSSRDGLIFLWETADAPNRVPDPETGAERSVVLTAHGGARLDHAYAMRPAGGWFGAPAELAQAIRRAGQATNELSMEVVLEPPAGEAAGSLVELASGGRRLVRLRQEGRRLLFSILDRKLASPLAEVELLRWDRGLGKRHLAISYSAGIFRAFLDGRPLEVDSSVLTGDFFHWRDTDLVFGGGGEWGGTLEGVAFYDRLLSEAEVAENARRYARQLAERPGLPRWRVRARREECSPSPSLASIAPYREALRVCRYRVLEVVEGEARSLGTGSSEGIVQAVTWAILDGEEVRLPAAEGQLVLERYADHRQLESLYLENTLGPPAGGRLFYVVE